ncbi:NAD(P)H-dependent amine dehydrogenase family protein [Paenibacillus senegalensis]|uniref:NAD(P)H-dependent amine dehydrogenase family protein n=1 Tax=Paenibacillus senegalensis TaxID=1465766 RepID=UPI0002886A01|nr:hypothetical protein [Paenibacillus senegalensis]
MNEGKLKVLAYGLGPIGIKIAQHCLTSEAITVEAAVDIDPAKVGRDLGELTGGQSVGVPVVNNLTEVKANTSPGRKIAFHATGSNLEAVWPQIRQLLDHGYSVVSTCEQLSYPWHRYPELAEEIDQYAKSKGQVVIGTGVNPGYVMDALALFATSVTQSITRIFVSRKVDVSKRRIPLQKKVGIGMTPEAFNELAEQDRIGHVGLEESLRLLAYGLNEEVPSVSNLIEPTIAQENMEMALGPVAKGQVSGLHQVSKAVTSSNVPIELDLIMSAGVGQEDRITLVSEDMGTVEFVIPGGIFGDTATANIIVNTAKTVSGYAQSGLLTMADIPLTRNKQSKPAASSLAGAS